MMNIKKLLLLVTCLFTSAAFGADGEVLVERIVAVVDGLPVLHGDVQEKVDKGPLVVVSDFPADENSPPYERAMQDAINLELVMGKARDLEIDVRDEEVESEIKGFLESRNLPREGLMSHLKEQGMTYEEYKKDFQDQMVLRQFQGRVIKPLVKITDKDIETYYLKKTGSTQDMIELQLRQILISINDSMTPEVVEAKRKLADEVHQKLSGGMDFADAVKIYSDDPKARESGGAMPGMRLKDLADVIRAEVEALEPGQFSPPVKTSLGFHVFFLEAKQFAGSTEFATQKKQLEFELYSIELANQTRRWLSEQRQRSKIEIVN